MFTERLICHRRQVLHRIVQNKLIEVFLHTHPFALNIIGGPAFLRFLGE